MGREFVASVEGRKLKKIKDDVVKVERKKNFWSKSYKASQDRESIVDMFCAEFAHEIGDMAGREVPQNQLIETIRKWNRDAQRFSVAMVDFKEGWRIHKDWFKCMLAQLYLAGAKESDAYSYNEYTIRAKAIFSHLGWDFESSRRPVYNNITTVYDIEYRYVDGGFEESRFYRVILEPTDTFPVNAMYESGAGKKWEVLGASDLEVELISCEKDGNGNYPTIKMIPSMVSKMKRIL